MHGCTYDAPFGELMLNAHNVYPQTKDCAIELMSEPDAIQTVGLDTVDTIDTTLSSVWQVKRVL